jgi:hypothetical protein
MIIQGGSFNPGVSTGGSFRANDPWWDTADNHDWAFHSIDLPRAWSVFGSQEKNEVIYMS